MGFNQVVTEVADLIDSELGSGVRVEHGSLVNTVLAEFKGGINSEHLNIDVSAVIGGANLGEVANITTLHAVGVDQTRHLDTRLGREVGDQAVVKDITTNLNWLVGLNRFHDI